MSAEKASSSLYLAKDPTVDDLKKGMTTGTMQCRAAFGHHLERFDKRLSYTHFDD